MQNFPIALIKFITEFVPTPLELIEYELETKGLPFIAENKMCKTLYICRIPACKIQAPSVEVNDINEPFYITEMRALVRATKLRHVKMRSDLMAFHLSKV